MIDYSLIASSIDFYQERGFKRVEAPWTVTPAISNITKPDDVEVDWKLEHNQKVLVASGEQSFLYLYLKEFLPLGKFQATTPCFRYENFDQLHTKYFLKNELIITDEVTREKLDATIDAALEFFSRYIPVSFLDIRTNRVRHTKEMKEQYSHDIVMVVSKAKLEIELGSYGIRECSYLKWVYGTGCAEPRLSTTMKQFIQTQ